MGVVALQVALYQVVGNYVGVVLRDAALVEESEAQLVQHVVLDYRHV